MPTAPPSRGVKVGEEHEEAHRQGGIADARDDERLHGGLPIGRVFVPEADQEVTAETDALPAEVEQKEVIRQHQDQHGRHKEVHAGKETAVALAGR